MFTEGRRIISRENSSQENTIRVLKRKTAWCKALVISLLRTDVRDTGMLKPDKNAVITNVSGSTIHRLHLIQIRISSHHVGLMRSKPRPEKSFAMDDEKATIN